MGDTCIIYGLCDPCTQQLRYVGKTVGRLELRVRHHCTPHNLKRATHPASWLRSLRRAGLKPEAFIIEEVPTAEQNDAERFWIAYFRYIGADLTNHTAGGTGGPTRLGMKHTPEMRTRMIEVLKAAREKSRLMPHHWTLEERRRARALQLGRKRDAKARANISRAKTGLRWSEARRAAYLANPYDGRSFSDETRQRISESKRGKCTPAMRAALERVWESNRGRTLGAERREQNRQAVAKLTWDGVRGIRRLCAETSMSNGEIGKLYGVSQRTIRSIRLHETWNDDSEVDV